MRGSATSVFVGFRNSPGVASEPAVKTAQILKKRLRVTNAGCNEDFAVESAEL